MPPDLLTELTRLELAWRRRHPHRAAGGAGAINGFRYQFVETLYRATLRFAQTSAENSWSVHPERISDLVEVGPDTAVITQAKKTADKKGIFSALDELWLIHQLAHETSPTLAEHLRLVIRTPTGIRDRVEKYVAEWRGTIPDDTAAFIRCLGHEHESGSLERLYVLLFERYRLRDPVRWVDEWVGRLVAVVGDEGGHQSFSRELWSALATLETSRDGVRGLTFHLWTDRDAPPPSVEAGDVLTGERPRVADLRAGNFATRPHRLDVVLADFHAFAERSIDTRTHGRVPVFWIAGRSGTGKSVLLLQLLAALHAEGAGTIAWLDDKAESLADAAAWGRQFATGSSPFVIGVDDPYQPGVHAEVYGWWREMVTSLSRFRQDGNADDLPLIVCCGPTEQADRLADDFPDELDLTTSTLSPETQQDYDELREWYGRRVGQAPTVEPARNTLMVQLLFEWRQGESLRSFALRFRDRLVAMDESGALHHVVTGILAANRLYTGYPVSAVTSQLTASQRGALEILLEQEHLEFQQSGRRRGAWLAHPHLANVIYIAWFRSRYHRPARIDHLRVAIADSLRYGRPGAEQMTLLWGLVRALRDPRSEVGRRLDVEATTELLRETYREQSRAGAARSFTQLPLWIEADAQVPGCVPAPAPTQVAITALGSLSSVKHVGLRLTCHKLIQWASRDRNRVFTAVLEVLDHNRDWYDWMPVATDLISIAETPDDLYSIGRLAADVVNRTWEDSGSILLACFRHPQADPALARIATAMIDEAPHSATWSRVAHSMLVHGADSASQAAVGWMRRDPLNPLHASVLAGALDKADENHGALFDFAMDWARENCGTRRANRVLERLLTLQPTRTETHDLAAHWIRQWGADNDRLVEILVTAAARPDIGARWLESAPLSARAWVTVWISVAERTEVDDTLLRRGLQWLDERGSDNRWGHVWTTLRGQASLRELLDGLGLTWVRDNQDIPSWPVVWERLWLDGTDRPQLTTIAAQWLDRRGGDAAVPYVLEFLLRDGPDLTGEHREFARTWLRAHPDVVSWAHLWRVLRDISGPGETETSTIVHEWLGSQQDHKYWAHVWSDVVDGAPDADLARIGLRWLEQRPENASWQVVWSTLYGRPGDSLEKVTRQWLTTQTEHVSWGYVWQILVGDGNPLADEGFRWLDRQTDHHSWIYVWQRVLETLGTSDRLRDLALLWLEQKPSDRSWARLWLQLWKNWPTRESASVALDWLPKHSTHSSWNYVWRKLLEECPDVADDLRTTSRTWLSERQEHPGWSFVWEDMWKAAPGDDQLFRAGVEWLEKYPNHPSWGYVWSRAWSHESARPELAPVGMQWAADCPHHPQWFYVVEDLRKRDACATELDDRIDDWLLANSSNTGWPLMWRKRLAEGKLDAAGLALGERWLTEHRHHNDWPAVWRACYSGRVTEVADGLAREWLQESPNHNAWRTVWEELWLHGNGDDALAAVALEWLRLPETQAGWPHVWEWLWAMAEDRTPLGPLALRWMQHEPNLRFNWPLVWIELWRSDPGSSQLHDLVPELLRRSPAESSCWISVVTGIEADDLSPAIVDVVLEWLRQIAPDDLRWEVAWEAVYRSDRRTTELVEVAAERLECLGGS